jgi:predicted TIM-barrel enzyme
VIGAGAGTGISAKFEEQGGADLIVIYNSGRFRMAGRGSLSGLMPYKDANAVVLEMADEVIPVRFSLLAEFMARKFVQYKGKY